jgi:hypothetical protein
LLPPCCYRKSSTARKCSNISWEHFLAREDPDALAEALAMMFALRLTGHSAVRGEDHLELVPLVVEAENGLPSKKVAWRSRQGTHRKKKIAVGNERK